MSELFLFILNRSISALWLVGAVLLARLVLKKAPKWVFVVLWAVVALRLVLPALPESPVSLVPSSQTVSPEIMLDPKPTIQTGVPVLNSAINPVITHSFTPNPVDSVNPLQILIPIGALVWLAGVAGMVLYAFISTGLLRRRLRGAVEEEAGVYRCTAVSSPFILGLLRPRIYLPQSMDEPERSHVLAHERAHLARRDHWWKPVGFLLLSIHWFNPVLWFAYILLCRDIELACDERVIRWLSPAQRADYSQTLLRLSVRGRPIAACPLAFGETGVKGRIKSVLNYRKPAFWLIVVSVLLCAVVAVCFLTDPKTADDGPILPGGDPYIPLEELPEDYSLGQAKLDGCVVMEDGDITWGWDIWQEFYEATRQGIPAAVRYVHYYTLGDPSRYGNEYYESIKDDYPKMFVHDLSFDGSVYRVRWFEESGEINRRYQYLHCFQGKPESPYATYDSHTRFVLCDLPNITWEDIFNGMVSSHFGDYIDHMSVVTDLIRSGETGENRLAVGTYIPVQCIYISPLSSYSGTQLSQSYLYQVTEDSFLTKYLPDGSSSETAVDWQWAPALLSSKPFQGHPLYPFLAQEGCRYQQIGNDQYLMQRDSLLYLVRTGDPSSKHTAIWSIYALLPETGHTAQVVNLLDTICLFPAYSSNPGDYIEAHRAEYNALVGMGTEALEVCFTLFLQGTETGLRGHIMALACRDVLAQLGEAAVTEGNFFTGQEWFDAFLSAVQSLQSQYRPSELKSRYPGSYRLLQLCGTL